jgi:hypothetical protein
MVRKDLEWRLVILERVKARTELSEGRSAAKRASNNLEEGISRHKKGCGKEKEEGNSFPCPVITILLTIRSLHEYSAYHRYHGSGWFVSGRTPAG